MRVLMYDCVYRLKGSIHTERKRTRESEIFYFDVDDTQNEL